MKILALIINGETTPSDIPEIDFQIVKTIDKQDEATIINKIIKEIDSQYTHIIILPNNNYLYDNYLSIIQEYYDNDQSLYLPLISLSDNSNVFKGILNSSIWWPSLVQDPGVLDKQGALMQLDTTIYGGLIPIKILQKYNFKKDLNIFYQFEFLNKILSKKVNVIGVPKILASVSFDYSLEKIDKEEKIKLFENARKDYQPKEV